MIRWCEGGVGILPAVLLFDLPLVANLVCNPLIVASNAQMIVINMQLLMAIVGIAISLYGKIATSEQRAVSGWPARILGLLLVLCAVMSLVAQYFIVRLGWDRFRGISNSLPGMIDIFVLVVGALLVGVAALILSKPVTRLPPTT